MAEHVDTILRLVAEGRLSADEAEPVLAALTEGDQTPPLPAGPPAPPPLPAGPAAPTAPPPPDAPTTASTARRQLRIEVTERGRRVVNLRIPLGFAGMAAALVPGLAPEHTDRIRDAIRAGSVGPILEVEGDEGDRVVIATE